MLSLPDDWDYSLQGLSKTCKDSKDAIRTGLNELKDNGYVEVKKYLPNENTTGRILYEYLIYEEPQPKKQGGKIKRCFSDAENPTQLNTNKKELNKKKNSKKKITYEQREYTENELNKLYANNDKANM